MIDHQVVAHAFCCMSRMFCQTCRHDDDMVVLIHNESTYDWQEKLELRRKLLFRVEPVRKVDPADSAVCMNLDS